MPEIKGPGGPIHVPVELMDPVHVESCILGRGSAGVQLLFYRRALSVEEAKRQHSATFEAVANVAFPPGAWKGFLEQLKKLPR